MRGMTFEQATEYINALRDEYRAEVRAYEAEQEARQKSAARKALEKRARASQKPNSKSTADQEPWERWYARIRKECEAQKSEMR